MTPNIGPALTARVEAPCVWNWLGARDVLFTVWMLSTKEPQGNTCQNGLMPALVRPTLPAIQTSLGMKQFLPFPLDTASAVSLFPGFNTPSAVKVRRSRHDHLASSLSCPVTLFASTETGSVSGGAVLNFEMDRPSVGYGPGAESCPPSHPRPPSHCQKEARLLQCLPAEVQLTAERGQKWSQALAHYKGTKHAKKLKALDAPKSKLKSSVVTKETTNQEIAKGINTLQSPNNTDMKDGVPGAGSLPSPVLRLAQPLASLATTPTPAPVASQIFPHATPTTAQETTSAAGGDERPAKLSSPLEPDLEPEAEPEAEADTETEEEKARRLLYCSLCKVAVNSASQLEAHNSGTKHKTMLEARSGVGSIKSFPRPGVKSKLATSTKSSTGLQNKTFYCETCDVHVNSETQLKQHISSRRHKDRAAGKPAKPKYSPYSKPQKGQTKQTIKLTLGKERQCQRLTTQIIPAHLAAVAAAIGNSFAHRTNHTTNHAPTPALFQTQTLPAALLRPAPGPVRTSHPQVLFAPY
ncbi:Zinc finger protein 385D Zinc finger protein 659 [Channa argus]|uniref:Zinc finger protein 385D Zinc finger protein 659 n=1 Tax=Channa argus TaxID=215402 RepID=A0A6G1PQ65_CHAAH|nr:Zinc finger protein 385D Zinc finger protein 659 [Channa argus]